MEAVGRKEKKTERKNESIWGHFWKVLVDLMKACKPNGMGTSSEGGAHAYETERKRMRSEREILRIKKDRRNDGTGNGTHRFPPPLPPSLCVLPSG